MQEVTFKVIKNISQAKLVWEYFSPDNTIDDQWDFRYAFYNYLKFSLYFIVGYANGKPMGLLSLQFNTGKGPIPESYPIKKNFYEFFGGDDTDDNRIFLSQGYEDHTSKFLAHVPENTVLSPLTVPYQYQSIHSEYCTNKYIADLSHIFTISDFSQTYFSGKERQKIMNKMNRLAKQYDVTVHEATKGELSLLFAYNKQRFGELSSFNWDYRKQIFRDLMDIYVTDVFTIMIDGEIKAVSFSIVYKGTYLSMNIGYDYTIRDLGKQVVLTQLERAIARKCHTFDAGKGDSGWKEQFHLTKIPQYTLTLPYHETITPATTV